jgi:hypothetical protein
LESQLRQAQDEVSAIRQQYRRELETAAASEKQHQEARQQLAQRLDELEQKLNTEGPGNQPTVREPGTAEVNFPIYALVAAPRSQAPTPVEIAPPASSSRFALSIPVQDPEDFGVYRVTIVNDKGTTVWKRSGFRPDAHHALSLSLNANFLTPGTYDLRVEGLDQAKQWSTVGSYPFRFVRRR